MPGVGNPTRVRLWDIPTRIVHWSLAVLVPFAWWSAEQHDMERHRAAGYVILGLLIFRLIWGFIGSSTARFSGFVRGPAKVLSYARGKGDDAAPGHNPLGGWSVIAMILLLLTQVGLGLFASDTDGLESGPLSYMVSFETATTLADRHETMFNVLAAIIALHIAAVLFYLFVRRDNLITPMIGGARIYDVAPAVPPTMASLGRAAVAALAAAGIAWWVSQGLPLPA
ncbi:cytochrome b/b6 domain-containing protein [Sphingoaurantiacus capsulatus]|uniref:Cytochrome b/b6 domain-containing protein n=1 Tax=Sphingoaurantiacus capsulatus TaxID=1771310 RepID=A0ABV7XB43_9SPHN